MSCTIVLIMYEFVWIDAWFLLICACILLGCARSRTHYSLFNSKEKIRVHIFIWVYLSVSYMYTISLANMYEYLLIFFLLLTTQNIGGFQCFPLRWNPFDWQSFFFVFLYSNEFRSISSSSSSFFRFRYYYREMVLAKEHRYIVCSF